MRPPNRIQNRSAGIDVKRVPKFVRLRRRHRFDAGAQMPRVMAAGAAAADGAEQVAQGAVAEEVERLVGHFELHLAGILS